jgi:glycosyltransferase involved in cell wall biosynthesis
MQSTISINKALPAATIIIPAYNEEKRIKNVLSEIADFISKNNVNWNVIVSIDGNDGTEGIVKGMMREYSFISYDKNHFRGGKGWAIKRVVNRASGEFTILMDADGSISFSDIIKAMNMTESYDVIIFDRYYRNKSEIPLIRRIPSRGFNILVKVLLGIKLNDTQCGYKIMRTYMLREAFTKVAVTNAFYDVDLLYHLHKMKAKIIEINAEYSHDRNSKFNVFFLIVGLGISLMAFGLRHSRFYKYVPDWARELYSRKFRW